MICSRCKKRMAVMFISKMEGDKTVNEGLCLKCAKELGIPQVNSLMEQMGISDEEIDMMSEQMMGLENLGDDGDFFESGGANMMPNFLQNMFGGGNKEIEQTDTDSASGQGKSQKGKPNEKKSAKRKFLTTYCTNLTARARKGELDTIVGRDSEIYRLIQILSRRTKNNPCLIICIHHANKRSIFVYCVTQFI